ncbi:hypothetical protein CUMW_222830 [Citrus unshiu]|uniref:Uncharacterized protein n=1 Tax=Citrus unshiu TaxID=55188 RepID=A0A2H5QEL5_CITUN|nr:hypothetical protein CUMW_222830 [Citrus unshiu]
MAIGLKTVWTLRIASRHRSTYIRILDQQGHDTHQSMPHHQSIPHHRSVYVNSVVNSNVDSIVHVNSVIFPLSSS